MQVADMSRLDSKRLVKVLRQVGARPYQVTMAATLLAVNGIENALEFVHGLQARGLTSVPADAMIEAIQAQPAEGEIDHDDD